MALKDEEDAQVGGEQAAEEEGEVIAIEQPPERQADERVSQQAQEEGEEGDEHLATDAEREARRLERRARKERERAAKERNRRELDFLRTRNEQLERRFSEYERRQVGSEAAIIDGKLEAVGAQIRQAEDIHAAAVSANKGDDATEALRIRDQLRDYQARLTIHREELRRAVAPRDQQQPPAQAAQPQAAIAPEQEVSEELINHADKWIKANSWYKPDRSDQDSRIAGAIDDGLVAEGFDPETGEYWAELSKRIRDALPHKFQQQQPDRRPNGQSNGRSAPAMANGGRGERALRPGEVYVSPERRKAMEEAGVWDDPKLRQRYLKRYQQYDAEHGTGRG